MTTPHHEVRSAPRGSLRGLVARRPLTSFFVLALGLSWLAWLPYVLSLNGIGVWDYRFPEILGSSQLSGVLPGAYLGPVGGAFLVTALADGRPGLRRWVSRLWRWRVRWTWYAVALVGVPVAVLASGAAFSGGDIHAPSLLALVAYVPALLLQMVTTGLAEEPGWRDFALPRLQRRWGPIRASLLLGPIWGVWHLPLFLSDWGGFPNAHWSEPVTFVAFCIAVTFVITWFFNRTGESLPLVVLFHVGINNTSSVLWAEMFPTVGSDRNILALLITATLVAIVLLVVTRGRLGYPQEAPDVEEHATAERALLVDSGDVRR
jgi:membrane protease YdiL (CAAX protease family)